MLYDMCPDYEKEVPEWLKLNVDEALPLGEIITWVPTQNFETSSLIKIPRYPRKIDEKDLNENPLLENFIIFKIGNKDTLRLTGVRNEQISAQIGLAARDSLSNVMVKVNEINKPKWIHGNSLNGPVENSLVVSHITSTKAHLSWSMNNQPEIEVYNLFVITQGGGGTTLKKNATPNADNNHISIPGLAPETTYTATLTYLDYYGNQVGSSISVDFTTLSDVGGKSAPSPNNPVETNDGTVPSPKKPIETNDGTASSPKNPIKTNNGTTFSLYPNPTSGELIIDFSLEQPSPVGIELFDLSGRLLFKESDYRDKGQHKFRFGNLRSYHNGNAIVLIKMTTSDSSIVKRVVIK